MGQFTQAFGLGWYVSRFQRSTIVSGRAGLAGLLAYDVTTAVRGGVQMRMGMRM